MSVIRIFTVQLASLLAAIALSTKSMPQVIPDCDTAIEIDDPNAIIAMLEQDRFDVLALNSTTQTSVSRNWGPESGDYEVTLGGNGASDKDFENGGFGLSGSWGYFHTDALELTIRQSLNYADVGESFWNGSIRFAVDYHSLSNEIRPFLGANFSGV